MQNSDEYLQHPGIGMGGEGWRGGQGGGGEYAANVIIFRMVQKQIVLVAVAEQQSHGGIQSEQMCGGRVQPTWSEKSEHGGSWWRSLAWLSSSSHSCDPPKYIF